MWEVFTDRARPTGDVALEPIAVHEETPPGSRAESSPSDSVLASLAAAQEEYRSLRTFWEHRMSELTETTSDLQARICDLDGQLKETEQLADVRARQAEHERRKAQRQRERTGQLSSTLKEVYRAVLAGSTYEPLLNAALAVTAANRGLFLTHDGAEGAWRVRAAADFPDPAAPDVARARLLSEHLRQRGLPLLREGDLDGDPALVPETMRNWALAPVTTGHGKLGAILVADREGGDFDEDDLDALRCVAEQAAVAIEHSDHQRELRRTYVSTVLLLADAIELKDSYPHGHCETVLRYARQVSARLGLSPEERQIVSWVAMLHDVGKAGISDALLTRPGALLPMELEFVRSHAKMGADLLATVPALAEVAHGVRHHHEHYDGRGYPDGLRLEDIPVSSRIVSVVDAYCALVARRSYREALSPEAARRELERCAGSQFDPKIVEAFLSVVEVPEAEPDADAPADESPDMDPAETTAPAGSRGQAPGAPHDDRTPRKARPRTAPRRASR